MLFQELFPANKQSVEHFTKYFTEAGLKELSEYVRNQQTIGARKELQKELQEQMSRGDPFKDVSSSVYTVLFLMYMSAICHICECLVFEWVRRGGFVLLGTGVTGPGAAAVLFTVNCPSSPV